MTATSQRFLSCILHISLLPLSIWCVSTIALIHRRSLNKWELKCQWWKPSALISVVFMIQERNYGQDRLVIRSCLYLLSFIGNNIYVSYGFGWLLLDQQRSLDVYHVVLSISPFSQTLMIFVVDEAYRFDIRKKPEMGIQRNPLCELFVHSSFPTWIMEVKLITVTSTMMNNMNIGIWAEELLDLVMSRYPRNCQSRSLQDSYYQKRNGDLLGSRWVWGGNIMLHTSTFCHL